MKLLVLLGILFMAVLQVQARSLESWGSYTQILLETQQISLQCAKNIGPKAMNVPQFHGKQQYPEDDEGLKELWGCIWKKKEIINENGEVNADNLETYLVGSNLFRTLSSEGLKSAHQIAQECKNEEADDYRLKAIRIQNCLQSKGGLRLY